MDSSVFCWCLLVKIKMVNGGVQINFSPCLQVQTRVLYCLHVWYQTCVKQTESFSTIPTPQPLWTRPKSCQRNKIADLHKVVATIVVTLTKLMRSSRLSPSKQGVKMIETIQSALKEFIYSYLNLDKKLSRVNQINMMDRKIEAE